MAYLCNAYDASEDIELHQDNAQSTKLELEFRNLLLYMDARYLKKNIGLFKVIDPELIENKIHNDYK
jgi:hypothetical protein